MKESLFFLKKNILLRFGLSCIVCRYIQHTQRYLLCVTLAQLTGTCKLKVLLFCSRKKNTNLIITHLWSVTVCNCLLSAHFSDSIMHDVVFRNANSSRYIEIDLTVSMCGSRYNDQIILSFQPYTQTFEIRDVALAIHTMIMWLSFNYLILTGLANRINICSS